MPFSFFVDNVLADVQSTSKMHNFSVILFKLRVLNNEESAASLSFSTVFQGLFISVVLCLEVFKEDVEK